VKKLLGSTVSMVAAVAVAFGAVIGTGLIVGHMRQSEDTAFCQKVTPTTMMLRGAIVPVPADQLAASRAGCVAQRREQRGWFGAVWKTGGEEMATCAVDWGRYQQLSDTDTRAATTTILAPYGITDPLDAGSRTDQQRFISTCLAKKRTTP
jgi:hypothetical protein